MLRRFYRCAEDVLFPDAIIDKLIGDEVMALYLPDARRHRPRRRPGADARPRRELLAPSATARRGPFAEMGIGLDVGEAFVGNIGQRALYDFTAVGDVVNTASRLRAGGGRRGRAVRARRRGTARRDRARRVELSSRARRSRRRRIGSGSPPDGSIGCAYVASAFEEPSPAPQLPVGTC